MSKNIEIPNTYYVLDNISTCPIAVPLRDYSRKQADDCKEKRKFETIAKNIQDTWSYIEQRRGQGNEKIRLFLNPDGNWKDSINNQFHQPPK